MKADLHYLLSLIDSFPGKHMKTKTVLSLADVQAILSAAEKHAVEHQWPVTISVVDDGGSLLGLPCLDGAAPISAQIDPAKARTAALGRRESRLYEETINQYWKSDDTGSGVYVLGDCGGCCSIKKQMN